MNSLDCKILRKYFLLFSCVILVLFFIGCKKQNTVENEEEQNDVISEFFYSPEFDDGSWLEDLINSTMEELAADQLDSLLEIESIIKSPYSVSANEVDFVEHRLTDSNKNLVIMEYGEEIFSPQKINDQLVFVHKYKDTVIRQFFDKDYRLAKNEIWEIKENGENKKLKTEEYKYHELFLSRPVSKKTTIDDQSSQMLWQYDYNGRIISEEEIITKGKKKTSKKQIYIYKENSEVSPDFEYYENGVLLQKNIYTSKTEYSVQIFFEDEFSVKTFYDNNKKIKEQYFSNNELVREKSY